MITIRHAVEEDLKSICDVGRRNGLDYVLEDWKNFWSSNPYYAEFRDVPIGWMLESDSTPVGMVLNVHMMYDLEGESLRGGIGAGAAIDPPFRNKSLMLIGKAIRQKETDFHSVGSTNAPVTELMQVLARRVPSPDNDVPLLWPVDYHAFANAVLVRKGVKAAGMLSLPAGVALRGADLLRPRKRNTGVQVHTATAFDDGFDGFWQKLRFDGRRLRAVRTRAALDWRFQNDLRRKTLTVLTAFSGGELRGYLVLVESRRGEFGFNVHEVADLQALGGDVGVISTLLVEALAVAKAARSGMTKLRGFNAAKRAIAMTLRPYSYRSSLWQAWYTTGRPQLRGVLESADTWDFSPFDIF